MKRYQAILATAFGLASAETSYALEAGECNQSKVMGQSLKLEGQKSLILAGRVNISGHSITQVFSSNSAGEGYLLEGDKEIGKPSENFCVALKLSSVRVFDARKNGVPKESLRGGRHDEVLRSGERNGLRPMLQGYVVYKNVRTNLVTISGIISSGEGDMIFTNLDNNAVKMMSVYDKISYTENAIAVLSIQ